VWAGRWPRAFDLHILIPDRWGTHLSSRETGKIILQGWATRHILTDRVMALLLLYSFLFTMPEESSRRIRSLEYKGLGPVINTEVTSHDRCQRKGKILLDQKFQDLNDDGVDCPTIRGDLRW
jgi:hypothetical protein